MCPFTDRRLTAQVREMDGDEITGPGGSLH